jgi:hypothetical protein
LGWRSIVLCAVHIDYSFNNEWSSQEYTSIVVSILAVSYWSLLCCWTGILISIGTSMLSLVCLAGGFVALSQTWHLIIKFQIFEHLHSLLLLLLSKYLSTFVQILFSFLVIQMSVAMQPAGWTEFGCYMSPRRVSQRCFLPLHKWRLNGIYLLCPGKQM